MENGDIREIKGVAQSHKQSVGGQETEPRSLKPWRSVLTIIPSFPLVVPAVQTVFALSSTFLVLQLYQQIYLGGKKLVKFLVNVFLLYLPVACI